MLSTVCHAGAVLDLFTAERPEWGVTAAARQLGIPKSRAHDLLASLTAIGLLEHVPHGCYRLGWRSLALACAQLRTSPLRLQSAPVMREIAERHSAAAVLFVWDHGYLLCVDRQDPAQPLPIRLPRVGARFPANGSAAGKLLLAHRPSPEVRAHVRAARERNGEGSRTAESMEADLKRIRRRGYAAGRESSPNGVPAIAAPIRDGRDDVVAALSIATSNLQWEEWAPSYVDVSVRAADRISQALCAALAVGQRPTPLRATAGGSNPARA